MKVCAWVDGTAPLADAPVKESNVTFKPRLLLSLSSFFMLTTGSNADTRSFSEYSNTAASISQSLLFCAWAVPSSVQLAADNKPDIFFIFFMTWEWVDTWLKEQLA